MNDDENDKKSEDEKPSLQEMLDERSKIQGLPKTTAKKFKESVEQTLEEIETERPDYLDSILNQEGENSEKPVNDDKTNKKPKGRG